LPKLFADFMGPAAGATTGAAIASILIYIVMALILALRPKGLFAANTRGSGMSRETLINTVLAVALLALPFAAVSAGEPFYVTLATRMAILALGAVGLNLALGLGGLISFGHAAFFGIGGYVAGIFASHAF